MKVFIFLLSFTIFNAFALIDYSDSAPMIKNTSQTKVSNEVKSQLSWKSDLSLSTIYEIGEINSKKLGLLSVNTHVQTPFNVYFDLNFWQANFESQNQVGNPQFLVGFNWFRFGSPNDEARVNLYGGMRLSSKSNLGSSSTDKIFGIETTKRFHFFGLGLGYEVTMPSTPKSSNQIATGNIHRINASLGWMVSNDIQFHFEAENFRVSSSTESGRSERLLKEFSYSTLSPKLLLTLFPSVNFELGARYGMKKAKSDQNLSQMRLMNFHGTYSNSVFTGLEFSI